jgi:exodeoxyribonuclease V alpha subunit
MKTTAQRARAVNSPAATERLPAGAPAALAPYVAARVVTIEDVAAAAALVGMAVRGDRPPAPDVPCWVALCLALRAPRDGHTCVLLDRIADLAADLDPEQAGQLDLPATAEAWKTALASAGLLVGKPGDRTPFILDSDRLYLARSLHEEEQIAGRLVGSAGEKVEILLGGPGTGKTTEVAKRLIGIFQAKPETRIALAAPTGKAASRMAEALRSRLFDPEAPDDIKNAPQAVRDTAVGTAPMTIHKLLGNHPLGTPRYRVNASTSLDYELVVVDEASMLSSSLMHHLLEALGENTKLLLVGDPDQLASVDAGSVLGDIAAASRNGAKLSGSTRTLTERHRFGKRIGALADAILLGEVGVARVFDVLEGRWTPAPEPDPVKSAKPDMVSWIRPGTKEFRELEEKVIEHARQLERLATDGDLKDAVEFQKTLQVLCAHRSGRMGVAGWNALVERRIKVGGGSPWYTGRPIMVTRNNRALSLNNGDVGLVVPVLGETRMNAAFPAGEDPRRVPVSRLEDVETVHALTIHKSQGSEYGHAIVVLPEKPSRIVTRELLYTGVTRARDKVTVVGSREVIEAAIKTPIRRATGLAERLCRS